VSHFFLIFQFWSPYIIVIPSHQVCASWGWDVLQWHNVIPSLVKVNSQKVKELKWEGTHTQTASLSDIDTNKTYSHKTTFFPFLSGRLAN